MYGSSPELHRPLPYLPGRDFAMIIREQLEQQELKMLSPFACPNLGHAKRRKPETPCPYRTEFQRDRDRILHCNAFRRLKRKTQVFLSPSGDHQCPIYSLFWYVTRYSPLRLSALRTMYEYPPRTHGRLLLPVPMARLYSVMLHSPPGAVSFPIM